MALTHVETQVTWDTGNDTDSVTSGSSVESDEISINQTCFQASIALKADNAGTPAAGDTVTFKLLMSMGDTDGTGGDEFDDPEIAYFLIELDTNTVDPIQRSVPMPPMPIKKIKIEATNNAASNTMTVSALILEQRG